MKYGKSFLRKASLLKREKKYLSVRKLNFNLIFRLIKKNFKKKKIIIAGYYPSSHEVNILKFLENASKNRFKILLPVIKASNHMSFRQWDFNEPLYVNKSLS